MVPTTHTIKTKSGYFLGLAFMADEHMGSGTTRNGDMAYLRSGLYDFRKMFKCPIAFGKLGDEFEWDRDGFSQKLNGIGKSSDREGHENMARKFVDTAVHNYANLWKDGDIKLGAVGGNHKVRFTIGPKELEAANKGKFVPLDTSHLLAHKLGFPYLGDGHALISLRVICRGSTRIYRIVILHGNGKGSSPQADLVEFRRIKDMYGRVDLIVKAHSHKPLTTHWGEYNTESLRKGKVIVDETTIVNLGSLRGAMEIGKTDYGEKAEYSPIPTRFPIIALKLIEHIGTSGHKLEIRAIPITF